MLALRAQLVIRKQDVSDDSLLLSLESILTRLRHVQNFNHHAFVKLSYGRYEFAGTAKLLLCLPQTVSAYRIEGLGQVSKGHKEVAILLMAFFTYSRVGNFGQSVLLLLVEVCAVFP